jgi:Uma2 family endonuclease
MATTARLTSADLEVMPDDGKRYEIIDGDLYVTKQPSWDHQVVNGRVYAVLDAWSTVSGLGHATIAPGVIFAEDDDVAPDVVWVSDARFRQALDTAGHLRGIPEIVIEVLSAGAINARRDRETKLRLYSRRGVDEYWIGDPRTRTIDVYRRDGEALDLVQSLGVADTIRSPLLPGFEAKLEQIFAGVEG